MDRRDFLQLMASTGALAGMGGCIFGDGDGPPPGGTDASPDGATPDGGAPDGPAPDGGPPPDSRVPPTPRPDRASLHPYLVIPKLDSYRTSDPVWNNWAGVAWTDYPHPPHGFWFNVPEVGQSEDVVVPVINLGNKTTRHLVIEVYEGPRQDSFAIADAELRDRRGPFTLHPGIITGYAMTFTRKLAEGASAAICYDPFYDPIHAISAIGRLSPDRKNLGNCHGIMPPRYPGSY